MGVNFFYLEKYEKALTHFNESLELKKKYLCKKEKEIIQLIEEGSIKEEPNELEMFDFENKTYNIFEHQLNVAICYIMLRKFEDAF